MAFGGGEEAQLSLAKAGIKYADGIIVVVVVVEAIGWLSHKLHNHSEMQVKLPSVHRSCDTELSVCGLDKLSVTGDCCMGHQRDMLSEKSAAAVLSDS